MRRRRPHRGFTLVEVLVALAIVALGMAAVMSALTSSADTVTYLRDKTLAQWIALNQITSARLSAGPPAAGNSSGDTDFAGRSWHWRQEVVATAPGMVRIDVSVRPADAKGDDNSGWVATISGVWGDGVDHSPASTAGMWPGQGPAAGLPAGGIPAVGPAVISPPPGDAPLPGLPPDIPDPTAPSGTPDQTGGL